MRRLALALLVGLAACQAPPPLEPDPHESGTREAALPVSSPAGVGDEIVIGGHRFSTGVPVVLWDDPGGYDAYATRVRPGTEPDYVDEGTGRRYTPGRRTRGTPSRVLVRAGSTDLEELARGIDQFVVHFDVCGISRTCFDVLQHVVTRMCCMTVNRM